MDRDRLWLSFMALAVTAVSAARLTPAREPNLHVLFQRVAPAVALIETEEREPKAAGRTAATEEYTGSAFLITADGKMMTSAHVVEGAEAITAKFCGSTPIKARVIASNPAADVALLQLDRVPPRAAVAKLGDADRMEIGDPVIVVGSPLGIGPTLSYGHVGGRHHSHRPLGDVETGEQELLETDAAISSGNSGSPMFNLDGEVVGIVSFVLSEGDSPTGLNFVVTSNLARRLLLDRTLAPKS